MEISEKIRQGIELYGNDMSLSEIEDWYRDEEYGYFELTQDTDHKYGYYALNDFHAFSLIRKRRFKTCVAIGCAHGKDILPLANQVDRFIGIEPAEKWWREDISGTPATFMKPEVNGDIMLPDGSVDLVISLGVLHHIPNVSHVIAEISRVLEPGGIFIVREPISSMGDWRKPRRGLTSRERGISFKWLADKLRSANFDTIRSRRVMFSLTAKLPFPARPFNSKFIVFFDWIAAEFMSWNDHYWRDTVIKKVSPTSSYFVAVKN